MRTPLSWLSGIIAVTACVLAATVVLWSPGAEQDEVTHAPPAEDEPSPGSAKVPVAAAITLPRDVLGGEFVILENRMWTADELRAGDCWPGDDFPAPWGAGRLVEDDAGVAELGEGESLGYIDDFMLSREELSALERLPRLNAVAFDSWYETDVAENARVFALPGLRYLKVDADLLNEHTLPDTVVGLSLDGLPKKWNYPHVKAFETNVDYSGRIDSNPAPSELPHPAENLEFLSIYSWPGRVPLPRNLRFLMCSEPISPHNLKGLERLEWIDNPYYIVDGDRGLEELRHFDQLTRIGLDAPTISDEGLRQLSMAHQVEELEIDFGPDSGVTAAGLSCLARMPNLRSLSLKGVSDEQLSGLQGCATLEYLDLDCEGRLFGGEGLRVVRTLGGLQELNLCGIECFTGVGTAHLAGLDLEVAADFDGFLTETGCREVIANWPDDSLDFGYCDHLTDEAFRDLERAHYLRSLNLLGCDRLTRKTLDRILALVDLESLTLPAVDAVDDEYVKQLSAMTNLRAVSINGTRRVSEAGLLTLLDLPYLEAANLRGTGVTVKVIEKIHACQNLKSLELSWFGRDDPEYKAVWDLIDARPDLHVFAVAKGNPYAPDWHPEKR